MPKTAPIRKAIANKGVDITTIPTLEKLGIELPLTLNDETAPSFIRQVATAAGERMKKNDDLTDEVIKKAMLEIKEKIKKNPQYTLSENDLNKLYQKHANKFNLLYQQSKVDFIPIHLASLRQEITERYKYPPKGDNENKLVRAIESSELETGADLNKSAANAFKSECKRLFDQVKKDALAAPPKEKKNSSLLSSSINEIGDFTQSILKSFNDTTHKANASLRKLSESILPTYKPEQGKKERANTSEASQEKQVINELYASSRDTGPTSLPSQRFSTTTTSTSSSVAQSNKAVTFGFNASQSQAREERKERASTPAVKTDTKTKLAN